MCAFITTFVRAKLMTARIGMQEFGQYNRKLQSFFLFVHQQPVDAVQEVTSTLQWNSKGTLVDKVLSFLRHNSLLAHKSRTLVAFEEYCRNT